MKKIILGLLSLTLIFSACKKVEIGSLNVAIEGTIYDTKTNAVVEGATIELSSQGTDYTATTDANGYFRIGNFPSGDYIYTIEKEGYLSKRVEVSSTDIPVTEKTDIITLNQIINLAPLTETVSFTAYMNYSYKVAAANKEYTLRFSSGIIPPITGTTDENGLVTLENLPYDTYCYISFDFMEGEIHYKEEEGFNSSNNFNSIYIYGYRENLSLGIVSSSILNSSGLSKQDFDTAAVVSFRFTVPVDTNDYNIYFYNYANGDYLYEYDDDFKVSWEEGNMLMNIEMITNFTLDSQIGAYVGNFYSESHSTSFYQSYTFYTMKE